MYTPLNKAPKRDQRGWFTRQTAPVKAGLLVGGGAIVSLGAWFARAWSTDRGESQNRSGVRERSGDKTMSNGNAAGLPPGSYTRDTLPPPGPEVQAILDRASAKAQELREGRETSGGLPNGASAGRLVTGYRGKRKINITNKGQRRVKLT